LVGKKGWCFIVIIVIQCIIKSYFNHRFFNHWLTWISTGEKKNGRRNFRNKNEQRWGKFNLFKLSLAQLKRYIYNEYKLSFIELVKTDMDARNKEEKKKKKEKETSTHITIEKELYIYALTNLPKQHTHYGGESSIFYFSSLPILLCVFFLLQRMPLWVGCCSVLFVNK
jgi:hypothetical protein